MACHVGHQGTHDDNSKALDDKGKRCLKLPIPALWNSGIHNKKTRNFLEEKERTKTPERDWCGITVLYIYIWRGEGGKIA